MFTYPHLASRGQKPVIRLATKGEKEIVERFIAKHLHTKLCNGYIYFSKDTVYFSPINLTNLSEYFYFVHAGMKIGTIKKNTFKPCHHLFWCLQEKEDISTIRVTSDMVYKK
jgi:NOL1/NOP2/fmu family ribosome biogenesis protein